MFGNEMLDYLAEKHGKEAALEFQERFGGDNPYIPKRKPVDEVQEFIKQNFGTMSARQIARATGLTVRAIQNRLNRPISKQQGSLF